MCPFTSRPFGDALQMGGAGGGVAWLLSKITWSVSPFEESPDCPDWSAISEQVISEMTTEGFVGGKEKVKELLLPEELRIEV
jgi:hypothetical protein